MNTAGLPGNSRHYFELVAFLSHEDIQIKQGVKVLEQVTKFVYLGGTVTEDGRCTEDIRRGIGLACAAFGRLDKMWRTRSISLKTKMKLYWALVLPVLMYGH